MEEYLNKKTYSHAKTHDLVSKDSNWVEVPEGAEIAVKFKNDIDEHGVIFYKNNGKSSFSEKTKFWEHDSNWTMRELLDENHFDGDIDLSHRILWQRHTQPEELPFLDSLNDQYAEIEQVRKHRHYFKDVSNIAEIDVYTVLKLFEVSDPCLQHIVKKALCAGKRGHKDMMEDLRNIIDTAIRAVELNS